MPKGVGPNRVSLIWLSKPNFDCIVGYRGKENHISCACHGGFYDVDGTVLDNRPRILKIINEYADSELKAAGVNDMHPDTQTMQLTDEQKQEFLSDVTALANSDGGDLIAAAARDPRLKEREDESLKQLENIILRKKVETELLMSGDVESLPLKIAVKKGVVNLAGHVYSDEERRKAVSIVEAVTGVKKVVDAMQVVSYKRYKE